MRPSLGSTAMSANHYASETDNQSAQNDFEADLERIGTVAGGAIKQSVEKHEDKMTAMQTIGEHVAEMNDLLDGQDVPHDEQAAAAWFFLLQFAQ